MLAVIMEALRAIWPFVDERIAKDRAYKREHPCEAATFHRVMAATLPRWRWLARAWHASRATVWAAHCTAHERLRCDEAAETATRMVRAKLAHKRGDVV